MPVPLYQAKAELFRTLGHPVRVRVLEILEHGPAAVSELLQRLEIEPSRLSQQLAVLRRAGIVTSTRVGSAVTYQLAASDVAELMQGGPPGPDPGARRAGRTAGRAQPVHRGSRAVMALNFSRLTAMLPATAGWKAMRRNPRKDLLAGLTVAVVALPLALAFGAASGIRARAGVMTAIVAGALAAIFGGSNLQVSGPTGAMTVVLIPVIHRFGANGVLMVGLMAGGILVVAAFAGLGRAARYLPSPVIEWFTGVLR